MELRTTSTSRTESGASYAADASAPRLTTARVLLSPWLGLFTPQTTARRLLTAGPIAFWSLFVAHLLILAAGVAMLALWDATVSTTWVPAGPVPLAGTTTAPTSLGTLGYSTLGTRELSTRDLSTVWHEWHAEGVFGPAEVTFFFVILGVVFCTAFLAWLQLPFVHRAGSIRQSYGRAFRAVVAGAGWLILLTALIGGVGVLLSNLEQLGGRLLEVEWLVPAVPAAFAGLMYWVGRAARGVAPEHLEHELPPMCEGCGYDLTHRPADGRCPECGIDIATFLAPTRRRSGCSWERRRTVSSWRNDSWQVLSAPQRFYSRLRLRTPLRLARHSCWLHYSLIGCGAALWMFCMFAFLEALWRIDTDVWVCLGMLLACALPCVLYGTWRRRAMVLALARLLRRRMLRHRRRATTAARFLASWPYAVVAYVIIWMISADTFAQLWAVMNVPEAFALLGTLAFIAPLIGWLIHRTIGALVVTWWLIRGLLPDYRWAAKVICYEAAYLWLLCCYAGGLFTSIMLFEFWLSELLGRNVLWLRGVPLEIILLFGGTAGLCVLWFWRYRIAGRAIRWSNF